MFRLRTLCASLLMLFAMSGSSASAAGAAEPVSGWIETGSRSFTGEEGFTKAQGIASDGERIFFSWNLGLHSVGLDLQSPLASNAYDAIPYDLSAMGLNHIGDIDYFDDKIYAPIEDGSAYLHPYVVTYDAATLQPTGDRHALDQSLLTEGVPWVAIDPVRQVAYTAEWNDTTVLNVHRLSDFEITSTVTLSRKLGRIQGAKVYKGLLYASRDNGAEKSIEAIDPVTGQVTHLFDRNLGDGFEAEGIAFVTNDSGTTMLTSDIDQSDHRVSVHSYRVSGDVTPPAITELKARPSKVQRGRKIRFELRSSEVVSATATWSRCVGTMKKPCARTTPAGVAPTLALTAGANRFNLAPRSTSWATGRKFNPGRWRLTLIPTDVADAVGPVASTSFTVIKPKKSRPHRRR